MSGEILSSSHWTEYQLWDDDHWYAARYRGVDEEAAKQEARELWKLNSVMGVRTISMIVQVTNSNVKRQPKPSIKHQ